MTLKALQRLARIARRAFVLTALLASLSAPEALSQPVVLTPDAYPAVRRTDERFQSYNVEMAEIIGGRFWRPYADAPPRLHRRKRERKWAAPQVSMHRGRLLICPTHVCVRSPAP